MSNSDKPSKPIKPLKQPDVAPISQPSPKLELVKIISPNAIAEPLDSPIDAVVDTDELEPQLSNIADPQPNADLAKSERGCPIPPVTEALQYRAIGLVYGRYVPEDDLITKGMVITPDGTEIDAVLLGKTISIVKKRLDLSQEYLWVVYPRTRSKVGQLHIQITGVWAPEQMGKPDQPEDPGVEDGYFSIRGEVLAQSVEQDYVTIKIQRLADPKAPETSQSRFKLQLSGVLPGRPVGYFWDINAKRVENTLQIMDGRSIAPVITKSKFRKTGQDLKFKPRPKKYGDGEESPSAYGGSSRPQKRSDLPKPERPLLKSILKQDDSTEE